VPGWEREWEWETQLWPHERIIIANAMHASFKLCDMEYAALAASLAKPSSSVSIWHPWFSIATHGRMQADG
jgi:hypothetical protein